MKLSATLFSFRGRLNRAAYWLAVMTMGVAGIPIVFTIAIVTAPGAPGVGWLLALPIMLVLTWINLALAIKRLHDRDKSAWWLLLFYLAPLILDLVGQVLRLVGHMDSAGVILGLTAAGITISAFVEIGCLRGTAGPNSYGPDPLQ
jgi:uncharacterized membrane protein YhaH (DUF805 family)